MDFARCLPDTTQAEEDCARRCTKNNTVTEWMVN